MKDHIVVFVNDREVEIYTGMTVRHALIALETSLCKTVEDGESVVEDQRGFRLGLDGSLQDGARIFTRPR